MEPTTRATVRVAFFSRGRGRGHAVPDVALIEELGRLDPDIDVNWVSYGTGAATLRDLGSDPIDIQLPDDARFLDIHIRAARTIAELQPHIVIAHEEFAAAPAAKLIDTPVIILTDYFIDPRHIWMQCLDYADEVIFIDEHGLFSEPPGLASRIYYAGPLIRPFRYHPQDRDRARLELGLDPEVLVVLVLPGNWYTEERAPIAHLVLPAFRTLPIDRKVLIWMAGQDAERLRRLTSDQPDVVIKDTDWQIDRWMVACDLALTKGTRKTSLELASLAVPSISLSHGLNPIDETRIARIGTNSHLDARAVDAQALTHHITEALRYAVPVDQRPRAQQAGGLPLCARRLAAHIAAVRNGVKAHSVRVERPMDDTMDNQ